MKTMLAAAIKYATNHVIAHIPSHTVRLAWYRHVLGWRSGPGASSLMGQHVQMAGVRSSGMKGCIGNGSVINQGCHLYTTRALVIAENVSICAGAWLLTGRREM